MALPKPTSVPLVVSLPWYNATALSIRSGGRSGSKSAPIQSATGPSSAAVRLSALAAAAV
eukprot:CAMPEP_0205914052 /NCGR_PEP_ID=MMETSP1325-20131115/6974_1 /ASSEMBLY_ACC=CAM_ASM_000708 /TAXON_ID=236786 /ORGANISM="Florenciella sp., Strain RCC1007" /LENGTH=59 /DNA_ID=CAMNT_0053281055 /DNA_START=258 /DNA_END=437 /DNA_ORIENTATION=-